MIVAERPISISALNYLQRWDPAYLLVVWRTQIKILTQLEHAQTGSRMVLVRGPLDPDSVRYILANDDTYWRNMHSPTQLNNNRLDLPNVHLNNWLEGWTIDKSVHIRLPGDGLWFYSIEIAWDRFFPPKSLSIFLKGWIRYGRAGHVDGKLIIDKLYYWPIVLRSDSWILLCEANRWLALGLITAIKGNAHEEKSKWVVRLFYRKINKITVFFKLEYCLHSVNTIQDIPKGKTPITY